MNKVTEEQVERVMGALADALSPQRAALKDALRMLVNFHPEDRPLQFDRKMSKQTGYEAGDEKAPFISESYLYVLLGKEDARTVLAYVRRICEAAGFDLHDLYEKDDD